MVGRSTLRHWTLAALLLSAFAAAAANAAATASEAVAVLERVTGRPTIYSLADGGLRRVSLIREGAQYRLPIEIETGPDDAASFRLPDGEVAVAPGTQMRIAAPVGRGPNDGNLLQRIFQRAGSALFSVERRAVEHFEVETPFLVSVVKGTTFTVVVHEDGATVSLHEGHLQVNGGDGLGSVELWPGDVAYSGQDGVVQKLVGTLTRRAMADEALPGRERSAAPGTPGGSTDLAVRPASSERPTAPETAETSQTVTGNHTLEPAVVGLPDAADLALADFADAGDLVSDAALPDDVLTGELGLGDDLDLAAPSDLAAADLLGPAESGLVDDLATGDLVADLSAGAGDLVADLGVGAGDLVGDLGVGAGDLVADLGGTTGDLVGDIGGTAGDLVGGIGDTTGDLLAGLGGSAGDLLGDVGATAGDLLGGVTGGDGLLGGIGGSAGDLVAGVGGTAGAVVGDLGGGVGDLLGGVTDGTADLLDQTGSAVGDLAGTTGDTVGNTLEDVGDVAGGLIGAVTTPGGDPVQDLVGGLGTTGSDLVSGVAGGAADLGEDLTDTTEQLLGNVRGLLRGLRL